MKKKITQRFLLSLAVAMLAMVLVRLIPSTEWTDSGPTISIADDIAGIKAAANARNYPKALRHVAIVEGKVGTDAIYYRAAYLPDRIGDFENYCLTNQDSCRQTPMLSPLSRVYRRHNSDSEVIVTIGGSRSAGVCTAGERALEGRGATEFYFVRGHPAALNPSVGFLGMATLVVCLSNGAVIFETFDPDPIGNHDFDSEKRLLSELAQSYDYDNLDSVLKTASASQDHSLDGFLNQIKAAYAARDHDGAVTSIHKLEEYLETAHQYLILTLLPSHFAGYDETCSKPPNDCTRPHDLLPTRSYAASNSNHAFLIQVYNPEIKDGSNYSFNCSPARASESDYVSPEERNAEHFNVGRYEAKFYTRTRINEVGVTVVDQLSVIVCIEGGAVSFQTSNVSMSQELKRIAGVFDYSKLESYMKEFLIRNETGAE